MIHVYKKLTDALYKSRKAAPQFLFELKDDWRILIRLEEVASRDMLS